MIIIIDSVRPTVATARAPRCATQYTSTIAKTDSMTISKIIGIANISSARPSGASVKSVSTPRTASASVRRMRVLGCAGRVEFGSATVGDDSVMVLVRATNDDRRDRQVERNLFCGYPAR